MVYTKEEGGGARGAVTGNNAVQIGQTSRHHFIDVPIVAKLEREREIRRERTTEKGYQKELDLWCEI